MNALLKDRSVIVLRNEPDGNNVLVSAMQDDLGTDEIVQDIPNGDLISYIDNIIMVEDTAYLKRMIKARKQEELNKMPKGRINALNPVVRVHSEDAEHRQQEKRLWENERREWETEMATIKACIMGYNTGKRKKI